MILGDPVGIACLIHFNRTVEGLIVNSVRCKSSWNFQRRLRVVAGLFGPFRMARPEAHTCVSEDYFVKMRRPSEADGGPTTFFGR